MTSEINGGTVFKITPAGVLTTLYNFCSQGAFCNDGWYPSAVLVQGTDGNFYGTTEFGGFSLYCFLFDGCGAVFMVTPNGSVETTIYSFCVQANCPDGFNPPGGLVQATNGNLYGTTWGGTNGYGTVFEITAGGALTTLYNFDPTDGEYPRGSLVQASNGNFYGATSVGGANGLGTVFEFTAGGALSALYSFCSQPNCADGAEPLAGLVQASDGNLYGTTFAGGASGGGAVFEITAGEH